MKKKIALINQRYGLEVNGGSELQCRILAEKLLEFYDVEVLTTCAIDYVTWDNEYDAGTEQINGVTVRRFPTSKSRNSMEFDILSSKMFSTSEKNTLNSELEWIEAQGPFCPDFIDYMKVHSSDYDAIIYMTYLYFLTAKGIFHTPHDHVYLLPTAHEEPPIHLDYYKSVFSQAKGFIYNTIEEQELTERLFPVAHKPSIIAGVGVDLPQIELPDIRTVLSFTEDYLLYVGRIDESKGCSMLFEYFLQYKRLSNSNMKLVLVGKAVMAIPSDPNIISLGFVSDEIKFAAIEGCKALVLASEYESLSMVVLESLAMGRPVLVNGKCEVLKGHCEKSEAGFYFTDYYEFSNHLEYLVQNGDHYKKMQQNGKDYVATHYRWEVILQKITTLLDDGWNECKPKNIIEGIEYLSQNMSKYSSAVNLLEFDDVPEPITLPTNQRKFAEVSTTDLFEIDKLLQHMERVNHQWTYPMYRGIEKRSGLIGEMVYFFKKIVRKMIHFYIDPMVNDQISFNSNVTNSLNQIRNYIIEQENKIGIEDEL